MTEQTTVPGPWDSRLPVAEQAVALPADEGPAVVEPAEPAKRKLGWTPERKAAQAARMRQTANRQWTVGREKMLAQLATARHARKAKAKG